MMSWSAGLQLALRALWRNKTRAMLTTLGVVIGVASVIAMVAIGAGAQKRVAEQLEGMGTNNLVVRPGTAMHGGVRTGAGTSERLTREDADVLRDIDGIIAVGPSISTSEQVRYRGTNWATSIEGVTPDYISVRSWQIAEGAFLNDQHVMAAAHVCVLGQTVARELFGLVNPVGESVVLKGLSCRILGVLDAKGASAWGSDQDDVIMMPITTVQRKIKGVTHIDRIEIQTSGREAASRVMTDVTRIMRQRHRLTNDQPDDFRIFNRAELAQASEESARVFTWLLGSIASVSLMVGGIGIMNIMLVSVTERTREIGIRMALGARQQDILWQFLLEALMLSCAGGVLGVLLGLGSASIIAKFSEFPVTITSWSISVAFLFAALVGIFFGIHPARKASRLRPIEALRYE